MSRILVKDQTALYRTIQDMVVATSEVVSPPERLTVTEAATKYVKIREKNYSGAWSPDKTPYIVEPQDTLTSLDYTGMVFVGPARTGKSMMFQNWLAHTAICDPVDMMLIHMTQGTARDWSQTDLAKLLRNSEDVRKRLVPGRQNDNVFDKAFLSGMRLTIKYPSVTELSGKTIPRVWMMDYDRMPENVDGEGDAWTLGKKRTQTYKRHGMTVAESSPGYEITNPQWMAETPHEAPPCKGLLSIYNDSDRRRWYWKCPQCREAFMPDFKMLTWPKSNDPKECAEQVTMICPHDGFPMVPSFQYELNLSGKWLKEGEFWLPTGEVVGTPRRSDIAGFWMNGTAAGFTDWSEIVLKYLNAEMDYQRTGSEEKSKSVTNTDIGWPYLSKALETARLPEELKARAKHYSDRGVVPDGVAFLVTTIDVQAGKNAAFVCHTYGITLSGDVYHVDMWKIRKSLRTDEDGDPRPIDPATYPEDWDALIEGAIERTYPLADDSGRRMAVKILACDSGGAVREGYRKTTTSSGPIVSTTSNAYDFWRRLRDDPRGRKHHLRFHLLKGRSAEDGSTPDLQRTLPDSQQKDKFAIARGDVPVWLVNTNQTKDQVSNCLGRTEGVGQVHFPVWYDESGTKLNIDFLYSQLTAEVRTPTGWERPNRQHKNEAFDLLAYCFAFLTHPDIRFRQMDRDRVPGWANPDWSQNSLVLASGAATSPFAAKDDSGRMGLAELGSLLG